MNICNSDRYIAKDGNKYLYLRITIN